MVKTTLIEFPAFTGKETRRLYVYTPRSYKKDPERRYPVLYMFDGHNAFFDSDATYGKSWGLNDFLNSNNVDLIVVGLECHHGENDERTYEYCPYPIDYTRVYGGSKDEHDVYGHETLRWFTNVLKPMIDHKYRTLPSRKYTFLMGSSMGGLMAAYGLIKFNRVFSRAAALSPAFTICPDCFEETLANSKVSKNTIMYMDYGTNDIDLPLAMDLFRQASNALIEKGVSLTSRVIYRGTHTEECWALQMQYAIRVLMEDIQTF